MLDQPDSHIVLNKLNAEEAAKRLNKSETIKTSADRGYNMPALTNREEKRIISVKDDES